MREINYAGAIREAAEQMMEKDPRVFLIGQGCTSPWYVGSTCDGLLGKFGPKRIIDTPVSENAITGAALGAAIAGARPILIHPRMDFMFLAMDQIINQAANWFYMFGGKVPVPLVIRGIINRGGEQAAQHSQALEAMFSHAPGLKVVMPATPFDAKGLLISAIEDPSPVIYIDDRWLYDEKGRVPEEKYLVPIGKGIVRKPGKDITIVGISYMAKEGAKAGEELKKEGISAEVIDIRSVKPLDIPLVLKSVKKTGRLLITEAAWQFCSVAAEISAEVGAGAFKYLKSPIERVCLPDCPAPASKSLEGAYYPTFRDIVFTAKKVLRFKK